MSQNYQGESFNKKQFSSDLGQENGEPYYQDQPLTESESIEEPLNTDKLAAISGGITQEVSCFSCKPSTAPSFEGEPNPLQPSPTFPAPPYPSTSS
jgi:hypothetical protein